MLNIFMQKSENVKNSRYTILVRNPRYVTYMAQELKEHSISYTLAQIITFSLVSVCVTELMSKSSEPSAFSLNSLPLPWPSSSWRPTCTSKEAILCLVNSTYTYTHTHTRTHTCTHHTYKCTNTNTNINCKHQKHFRIQKVWLFLTFVTCEKWRYSMYCL